MAGCKYCGAQLQPEWDKLMCGECKRKYANKKAEYMRLAKEAIGPLTADSLPAIQNYIAKLQRFEKKEFGNDWLNV